MALEGFVIFPANEASIEQRRRVFHLDLTWGCFIGAGFVFFPPVNIFLRILPKRRRILLLRLRLPPLSFQYSLTLLITILRPNVRVDSVSSLLIF